MNLSDKLIEQVSELMRFNSFPEFYDWLGALFGEEALRKAKSRTEKIAQELEGSDFFVCYDAGTEEVIVQMKNEDQFNQSWPNLRKIFDQGGKRIVSIK